LSWLTKTLTSGIGRKALVAITGLGLVLFLIVHLSGNLLIYSDSPAFDAYAEGLHGMAIFPIAEWGLLTCAVAHVALVTWLTRDNRRACGRRARGTAYAMSGTKRPEKMRAIASKTMMVTGLIVLVFLVVHVTDFRLRHAEIAEARQSLRGVIIFTLSVPLHALLYLVGSLLVGFHLFHGIQSAVRSLGFYHPKYTPLIEKAGMGLGILLGLGFAAIPAWIVLTAR
jgi:succinate dehydrogenase / fumarate reductase cytochrome b subunit